MKKGLSFLALTAFTSLIFLIPVKAIEYDYLGARPAYPDSKIENSSSWFIYNLDKGQKKEDALYAINNFNSKSDVVIYAADSVNSSDGGFALKQFVEPKTDLGSWIKFYPDDVPAVFNKLFLQKKSSIVDFCNSDISNGYSDTDISSFKNWCAGVEVVNLSIPANKQRLLKFVFSVPKNVDVGEIRGGILIQKKEPDLVDGENKQGVSLTTRVGIRIYETIPGDILRKIEITNFSVKKNFNEFDFSKLFINGENSEFYNISTLVKNQGNVSIDFNETITITDELTGKGSQVISDRKFQALRQDTFASNFDWANPRIGKFSIQSTLSYQDSDNVTQNISTDKITVWIIPFREIISVAGLILVIFLGIRIYRLTKKFKLNRKVKIHKLK